MSTMSVYEDRIVQTDITDRKHAEARLADREQHYRSLIENARDIIATVSDTGEVTFINSAVQDVLGLSPSAVVGTSYLEWMHEDDRPLTRDRFALALAGQNMHEPMLVVRVRHAASGWRLLELTANLPHGNATGHSLIVTARDVTERLQLETQLRQAQKMEAIGQLAGGVAHDFNNLLTAILGYGELLEARLPEGSELSADLEEVLKAGRRAAALTRHLLAFSRKQVLQPRALNLNAVITELQKMLARVIGEDVEFRTRLAPNLGMVSADVGQIEQVLLNLCVNARDAMPQGGVLTVETSEVAAKEGVADGQAWIEPGRWVRLVVADAGSGMTPDVLAHAFEPFFTTKERGRGTGLGLSTVYGIVTQSKGHIAVHSEVGRGTRFHIYLPVAATAAPDVVHAVDEGVATGTETILLVEDDPTIRRLMRAELRRHGYTVVDAANATDALSAAAQQPSIDLLISDIVMPGGNGADLANALRGQRPGMRILLISGFSPDSQRVAIHPEACFLAKPFTGAALAAKVRECLKHAPVDLTLAGG